NPAGWNRKRSVPLALLLVNPGVVGGANAAAKRFAARQSGLPLVGLSRGTPRSPVPLCRPLQASGGRVPATRCRGHPQLQAVVIHPFPRIAVTKNAETFFAP